MKDMIRMCDAYPLDLSGKDYENLDGNNLTVRFFLAAGAGLAQRGGKATWMVRFSFALGWKVCGLDYMRM